MFMNHHPGKWPLWHKNQLLKAEHLFGLEDYLLSAHLFRELGPAYGVSAMNAGALRGSIHAGNVEIRAQDIKGLTFSGQPVILNDAHLSVKISVERSQSPFDLFICVNNTKRVFEVAPDSVSENNRIGKLSFEYGPNGIEDLQTDPNSLHLGCFKFVDNELLMVEHPMVVRLSALKSMSKNWESWIYPFRNALKLLYLDLSAAINESAKLAAMTLAHRLSFAWPYLPISTLFFELQALSWTRWLAMSGGDLDLFESDMLYEPLPRKINGDLLIKILTDIIHPDSIPMADRFLFKEGENKDYLVLNRQNEDRNPNLRISIMNRKNAGILALVVKAEAFDKPSEHTIIVEDQQEGKLDVKGTLRGDYIIFRRRFNNSLSFERKISFHGIKLEKDFEIYYFEFKQG